MTTYSPEHRRTVETLIAAGYTQAPQMHRRHNDDMAWQYVDGWAESTLTRRQMLDALPPERRERKFEEARIYGDDLDVVDRQPVRLAMRRWRDVQLGLDQWVAAEYSSGRIAEGYALVEVRDRGGRPEIGRPVQVRFPADVLAAIDEAAEAAGVGRPEWIRRACADSLARAASEE